METKHFSHNHPLVFVEALEGDGEKEVVCSGCKESLVGLGYKCSTVCDFFLHKSCYELPHEIQHPMHPNHTLVLEQRSKDIRRSRYCVACLGSCKNFYYHCNSCSFDLDIKCASRWRINNTGDDHPQHTFTPIFKQIQFTCEACGVESKGIASMCSICQFLIHTKCAHFPRKVNIFAHDHSLTHAFSLCQVKKPDDVFCKLCRKKIDTKYSAYYCDQGCAYVAHLTCAYDLQGSCPVDSSNITLDSQFHEQINLQDEGETVLGEIKHCSDHQRHSLCLSMNKELDDKFCEGCRQLILLDTSFYNCEQCNIFLHETCAKLPKKKRHLLHQHPLTLVSRGDCVFYCRACECYRKGFSYTCDECNSFSFDVQCSSLPETLKHESHQHSLLLAIYSKDQCKACSRLINDGYYRPRFVCTECDFALCFGCASLPLVARYEYDLHDFLKLTYGVEDDSGEYYCFICEERRNPDHWFYYCEKCDFAAHIRCIFMPLRRP